jgi:hypothetical protein
MKPIIMFFFSTVLSLGSSVLLGILFFLIFAHPVGWHQVPHWCSNYSFVYFLIVFLDRRRENKGFCTEW